MSLPKGGRGKQAPYKTIQVRCPEPVKLIVQEIIRQFHEQGTENLNTGITETDPKETTNAVRQWCVFARHNDGKLQFMGGYFSKADAQAQAHKHQREHHRLESIGDKPYIGAPPTYEVKEMLVAPVELYAKFDKQASDLQTKSTELEASLTVARNSVEPLKRENERLREQIKEYREKLENSSAEVERLQSSSNPPDPSNILNRLRKERRKSKADLKDVELVIELMQAIAL
jgi:FtsZ-binding cell division protein ZapB